MKKRITGIIICLLSATLMSCATKTRTLTLNFTADPVINSEVLLPVDLIVTREQVLKNIIRVGPEEWFGHPSREILLDDELYPFAIAGGEHRTQEVVLKEDISKVLIYADYEDTISREAQQLMIDCPEKKKCKFEILIRDNNLEMKK